LHYDDLVVSTNQHGEAIDKIARRRRITTSQAAQWLQAAEGGDALGVIATRHSVDVRTVRQHVDRARVEKELAAVRRSMVQAAADLHQQDLLGVAAGLEAVLDPSSHSLQFSLDLTPSVIRSAGKRYQALLKHTKGSGLPHALALWEAAAKRYAIGIGELQSQLRIEIAHTNLDPDGTVGAMLSLLAQCAGYGAVPPDDLPWDVQSGDLRKATFRILASATSLDEPRVIDAQEQYARLWTTISAASPVADLCALHSAGPLRERVRDLLEDLRLRRYLGPATCTWCPGSRTEPRRKSAK
jgi:hypothetical protein